MESRLNLSTASRANPDDSAVSMLRHLDAERGRSFTEHDYQELRRAVLDELAGGARLRPFTLFTFAIVELGLLVLTAIGIVNAHGSHLSDYSLALASGLAFLCGAGFLWFVVGGIRQDSQRSLAERLQELDELRQLRLVSDEEFHEIRSYVLNSRQRSDRI
jgi:hypothetical protein